MGQIQRAPKTTKGVFPEIKSVSTDAARERCGILLKNQTIETLLRQAKGESNLDRRSELEAKALTAIQDELSKPSTDKEKATDESHIQYPWEESSQKTTTAIVYLDSLFSKLKYTGITLYAANVLENHEGIGEGKSCLIARLSNDQGFILDAEEPDASGIVASDIFNPPKKLQRPKQLELKQKTQKKKAGIREIDASRHHRRLQLLPQKTFLDTEEYLRLGHYYHRQREHGEAEEWYLKAQDSNPLDPKIWSDLGSLYWRMSLPTPEEEENLTERYWARSDRLKRTAAECQNKAIELNPRYVEAYRHLGRMHRGLIPGLGGEDEAMEYFATALMIDPRDTETGTDLGWLFHVTHRDEEAESLLNAMIQLEDSGEGKPSSARQALGKMYESNAEYEKAEACFLGAIERDPNDIDALEALGGLYKNLDIMDSDSRSKGYLEKALKCYEKIIRIDPTNESVHFDLGEVYLRQADEEESKIWEKGEVFKNERTDPAQIVGALDEQPKIQKALESFEKYIELTGRPDSIHKKSMGRNMAQLFCDLLRPYETGKRLAQGGRTHEAQQQFINYLMLYGKPENLGELIDYDFMTSTTKQILKHTRAAKKLPAGIMFLEERMK
ncbi:MAG: tetratricopeptide repeat protein [Candidatus Altiarchaeota archaeon]